MCSDISVTLMKLTSRRLCRSEEFTIFLYVSFFIYHSLTQHAHTNAQVFITLILSTVHVSSLYTFLHSHESDPDIEFTQRNLSCRYRQRMDVGGHQVKNIKRYLSILVLIFLFYSPKAKGMPDCVPVSLLSHICLLTGAL